MQAPPAATFYYLHRPSWPHVCSDVIRTVTLLCTRHTALKARQLLNPSSLAGEKRTNAFIISLNYCPQPSLQNRERSRGWVEGVRTRTWPRRCTQVEHCSVGESLPDFSSSIPQLCLSPLVNKEPQCHSLCMSVCARARVLRVHWQEQVISKLISMTSAFEGY